jgi:hypothetical protein
VCPVPARSTPVSALLDPKGPLQNGYSQSHGRAACKRAHSAPPVRKRTQFPVGAWADQSAKTRGAGAQHSVAGLSAIDKPVEKMVQRSRATRKRATPHADCPANTLIKQCGGTSPSRSTSTCWSPEPNSRDRFRVTTRRMSPEGSRASGHVGKLLGEGEWKACTAPLRQDPSSYQPVVQLSKWDEGLTRCVSCC